MAVYIFILTCWLTQQVTSQLVLDMANNAFDDQYEGCIEAMEEKAPQLLKEELSMNEKFKNEWENAKEKWKQIKSNINYSENFNDFHGTAIVAYTGKIAKDFNRAVREFRLNSSDFQYKAFHYYLTRALQLLRTSQCNQVFRGSHTKFYYSGAGSVRFGQFTSSSLNRNVAVSPRFLGADGTLFIIRTCLGVNIKAFSLYPQEEEVLIPGYEVYQKVTVKQTGKNHNEISLEAPQKRKSNFNCFNSTPIHSKSDINFNSSGPVFLLLLLLLLAEP
ncbi:T-cell ecto-ADP-ribosyltransferase 1-like [Marmota marmota marmota]|uniref:NAD(P)(+)--arginine ADP-ribosyltransferase n=1 Tax=Marmota marmota marmota TaxID=9994 RepID=A0A8C5ZD80_MARMA|nr:T-cell ecto-ADP-ribosyltransferase 1-like [Marmota marmota marmota]XP_015332960.1 T-cell ecto-ADP-ribosyltransferase 1-like [Marmota marmota marmota]XP_015332961.1 T-cell ecto-ADP-ribosyltransferase 1-like [Marmota marmota marmota]XP_048644092.1 T-cell ecto-ADP-ribosyltransferase 1-like [Marmota marmota marmota]